MSFTGTSAYLVIFIILAVPVVIATVIIGRTSRFAHRKRQLIQNVIIAEYDPPANLSPAEVGYLFDSRIGKTELVATLVDLEQQGLIKLSYSKVDGLHIDKAATELPPGLNEHETLLLESLTGDTVFSLYALKLMPGFKSRVRRALQQKGYLKGPLDTIIYYAKRMLAAYVLVTIPIFILVIAFSGGSIETIVLALVLIFMLFFPILIGLSLIAMFLYNKLVGQPGLWTDKLKALWSQLEGYRDFVEQVELDELKFESEDLKVRSQNKVLPYAIALGLNTDWQKRFS